MELHAATQNSEQINLRKSVFARASETLNWTEASQLALESNPQLSSSRSQVTLARKQKKQQWHELIPNFHIFANLNKSITEISDLSKDDIDLSVVSNIKIPNPFRYYAQAYALALNELGSELSYKLQQRQTIIQLYLLFDAEKKLVQLENQQRQYELDIDDIAVTEAPASLIKIHELRLSYKLAREQHRTRLNLFFNTPGKNWRLSGSAPKVSYESKLDHLTFDKGFGQLGTQLQLIQIESSVIQLWNAKFQRIPSFNIGLSTPPVYGPTQDDFQFTGQDFGLFSGLNKSIKPYDILDKELMQNAELRAKKNREQLLVQMEKEISQLEINKTSYKHILSKKSILQQELKYAQSIHPSIELADSELTAINKLKKEIRLLERQQQQLDVQFWIWDEQYWN